MNATVRGQLDRLMAETSARQVGTSFYGFTDNEPTSVARLTFIADRFVGLHDFLAASLCLFRCGYEICGIQ